MHQVNTESFYIIIDIKVQLAVYFLTNNSLHVIGSPIILANKALIEAKIIISLTKITEDFMTKRSFIITAVLMFLMVAATSFAQNERYQWKLDSTKNDCQIYTSVIAGRDYIAAKAVCDIPARIDVVGSVIRDIANYKEWIEDCRETKMLKVVDEQNDVLIFWYHQHIPVLTDRDMVLKSKVAMNLPKGQIIIEANSTNEIPYDSGTKYIRMPSFNTLFTLNWIDQGHTKVAFIVDPDIAPLGSGIPNSAANPIIKTIPLKSLKRLAKMVKEKEYINIAKASKYNKLVEDAVKAGYIK